MNYKNTALFMGGFITLITTIIGISNNFSNVPFWDQWTSYIGFIGHVDNGNWSAVWVQHNEHRIVLTKLLFILDFRLFGGSAAFLLVSNLLIQTVLLCSLAYVLIKLFNKSSGAHLNSFGVLGFCSIFLFSWLQKENLEWGFQSQFFFVYLFAFLSFYLFSKANESTEKENQRLAMSVLAYLLSALSMAAGLLVGVTLLLQVIVFSRRIKHALVVIISSALIWGVYFYGLTSSSSILETYINEFTRAIQYVALYFGGPIYHISGNVFMATVIGSFYVGLTTAVVLYGVFKMNHLPERTALISMLVFIFGGALVVAAGRLEHGLIFATSSRYMTPVCIAWLISLALLFDVVFNKHHKSNTERSMTPEYLVVMVAISTLVPLLLYQSTVFRKNDFVLNNRYDAAMSIYSGVLDEGVISDIFPDPSSIGKLAEHAINQGYGIFHDFDVNVQKVLAADNVKSCNSILDDFKYVSLNGGWKIKSRADAQLHGGDIVIISNERVLGVGKLGPKPDHVDITAYARNSAGEHADLYIIDASDSVCVYPRKLSIPSDNVGVRQARFEFGKDYLLSKSQVYISNDAFKNAVYPDFIKPDFYTIGTFIGGDSFTGELKIQFYNKQSSPVYISYVTGPDSYRQSIRLYVEDGSSEEYLLPNSGGQWKILELLFEDKRVVAVDLIDSGDGWGEWSGLGLSN